MSVPSRSCSVLRLPSTICSGVVIVVALISFAIQNSKNPNPQTQKNFASSQFFWANPPSVVWLTLELEPKASENRAVSHYTLLIVSDLSWPRGAGRHCECEYMLYTCMSSFIRRDCNRQSNLSYYWALSTGLFLEGQPTGLRQCYLFLSHFPFLHYESILDLNSRSFWTLIVFTVFNLQWLL